MREQGEMKEKGLGASGWGESPEGDCKCMLNKDWFPRFVLQIRSFSGDKHYLWSLFFFQYQRGGSPLQREIYALLLFIYLFLRLYLLFIVYLFIF